MYGKYLGNDTVSAAALVRSLYGNHATLNMINDGYENLIIVVNETYVVRFPRTEEIWQNSRNERYVLKKLSSNTSLPTPKLLNVSENPAYLILAYLNGTQLSTEHIRGLPENTLREIGKNIATFASAFHQAITVAEFRPFFTPPSWSYNEYLKRVLFDRRDPNPAIDTLAKHYYHAWINKDDSGEQVVIHDDLHTGNLLFDDTYEVTGVLDFGATCIGTAEQELRQVYRFGDTALKSAASTYEKLSDRPFNQEIAKLWTITQELAAYCRNDSSLAHERAAENLRFWFPDLDLPV